MIGKWVIAIVLGLSGCCGVAAHPSPSDATGLDGSVTREVVAAVQRTRRAVREGDVHAFGAVPITREDRERLVAELGLRFGRFEWNAAGAKWRAVLPCAHRWTVTVAFDEPGGGRFVDALLELEFEEAGRTWTLVGASEPNLGYPAGWPWRHVGVPPGCRCPTGSPCRCSSATARIR